MKYLLLLLNLTANAETGTIPILSTETEPTQPPYTLRQQAPYQTLLQLGPGNTEAELYKWRILQNHEKPKKKCMEWMPIVVVVPRCLRSINKKDPPATDGYDEAYPLGRWEACLKGGKRENPRVEKRYDLRIELNCEQLRGREAKK